MSMRVGALYVLGVSALVLGLALLPVAPFSKASTANAASNDSDDITITAQIADSLRVDFSEPSSIQVEGREKPAPPEYFNGVRFMEQTANLQYYGANNGVNDVQYYAESFTAQKIAVVTGGDTAVQVLLQSAVNDNALVAIDLMCDHIPGITCPSAPAGGSHVIYPTTSAKTDEVNVSIDGQAGAPSNGLDDDTWGFTVHEDNTTGFAKVPKSSETAVKIIDCSGTGSDACSADANRKKTLVIGTKLTKKTLPGLYKGQVHYITIPVVP